MMGIVTKAPDQGVWAGWWEVALSQTSGIVEPRKLCAKGSRSSGSQEILQIYSV